MSTDYSRSRAFASWLASVVTDLRVVENIETGNRDSHWPCAELTEIGSDDQSVGLGSIDHQNKAAGIATSDGKYYNEVVDYRLTVYSPGTTSKSGSEVCSDTCKTIRDAIRALKASGFPTTMIDTAPTPDESYYVNGIKVTGQVAIDPDITVKPFLFRVALSLQVSFSAQYSRSQNAITAITCNDYEIEV